MYISWNVFLKFEIRNCYESWAFNTLKISDLKRNWPTEWTIYYCEWESF